MRATAVSTIGRRPKCKSKHPSVREGSEQCHGSGETQSDRDAIVARGVMVDVLMLFVSTCRASEFCVNSHFHLVLHDRYSDKTQCSSRENPDGRPRSWRDAAWSVHTCTVTDTDAQAHVSRHDSRDTRGLTRRADVPNECRIPVRPPRTVAPVGRYTVDRFGAVPAFLSHATECTVRCRLPSAGSVTLTVTLIGTAVARPVA